MKHVLLYADGRKKKAREIALTLQRWLSGEKVKATLQNSQDSFPPKLKDVDFVVSLGGDGTVLALASEAAPHKIPILAIDLGGLGFLATFPPAAAKQALTQVLQGKYQMEERMMLAVKVLSGSGGSGEELLHSWRALNEVVLHNRNSERLLHFNLQISEKEAAVFSADGLILATPTGSTAYSLSAGGPILSPKLKAFLITPICPHSLSSRPLVISSEETIRISSAREGQKFSLMIDGKPSELLQKEEIYIEKSGQTCPLIFMEDDFYRKLRIKLRWTGDYQRLSL